VRSGTSPTAREWEGRALKETGFNTRHLAFVAAGWLCSAPAKAADVAFGEYLAGECVTCHQKSGQSNGIPTIVGWPPDQFVAVLKSYKAKDRPNPVMQTIAARFGDAEMEALAAYFATLKPPAASSASAN
jgi:cytochrome c553